MIGIDSLTLQIRTQTIAASSLEVAPLGQAETGSLQSPGITSELSVLGQQLAEVARLADARNSGLDPTTLGARAVSLLAQISGDGYTANKARYDAEKPDSNDAGRLARAQQATDFVNGKSGVSNPFQSTSDDQLALIIYDDSGAFTTNERRAAWEQSQDRELAWRHASVAKAMEEYNSTGKLTHFFSEALDHYNGLPDIEQAQYPQDYAPRLQQWIDLDFNYQTNQAEGYGAAPTLLIEQLMAVGANGQAQVPDEITALWKTLQSQA